MKKYLIAAAALLACGTLSARHLTPGEALGRLSADGGPLHAPAATAEAAKLLYTAKATDIEQVYVFTKGSDKGFMVLSADDCAPALLAYSDDTAFDPDNIPDNMRYWLDEYARQISYAATAGGQTFQAEAPIKQRPAVAPKLTTLWDQGAPFNSYTPLHNNLPCPTGCVATALAQVMNWHKYPAKGTGSKSYNSTYVGKLGIDFDRLPFQWDKMLDRYYTTSPEENISAVADLMVAVGYACEMIYTCQESGASGFKAAEALFTYFGYNKSLSLETRSWYSINGWDDLVYAELTENGPVYYEGSGNGGGHAFVCDGYDDKTGLFHINWGWTGRGNGYYRLSALNPDFQGIGGNSTGYNYQQDIIRGFKESTGSADEQPTINFAPYMGVITPWTEAQLGQDITMLGYETADGFVNYSVVTVKGVEFGARFHNMSTGEDTYSLSSNGKHDFGPAYKVNIIKFTVPTTLAEGSYNITPVWRSNEGEWHAMRQSPQTRNYIPATVKGTTISFGLGEAEGRAEAKITEVPDYFTTAGDFTIKGSISAVGTSDFTGLLCAVFVKLNSSGGIDIVDQGEVIRVDVRCGETLDFEYTSYPRTQQKLTDGDDYGITIGNANTGELLSPIYAVKVGNRFGKLQMSTYNYSITGSNFLDPEKVWVNASIKVAAGEYEGPVAIGYSKVRDPFVPERFTVSGGEIHVIAGDDVPITFTGTVEGVEAGEIYYAHLMYKDDSDNWVPMSQYPVTVIIAKSFAGIDDVTSDSNSRTVYYDMYGRKVNTLSPGSLYIRVTGDKAEKVIAR